jgi:DNA polymerase III epsilon subunit-like protein
MSQVDWAAKGFEGAKLSALASQCGFFFDGHRAENDCLAGLEILARPLPSGRTALAHMLEAARKPTWPRAGSPRSSGFRTGFDSFLPLRRSAFCRPRSRERYAV